MCRLYEDQMNEAKAKAEELQRQLNESSTQRNRAQTESGEEGLYHSPLLVKVSTSDGVNSVCLPRHS